MKPKILSDEQIKKANERVLSRHGIKEPITFEEAIRFISDKERIAIIEEQNQERLQAQLDADVAYYEQEEKELVDSFTQTMREMVAQNRLEIQQAKAEVAREVVGLFKTIEAMYPELRQAYWGGKDWQSLKSKYGGQK